MKRRKRQRGISPAVTGLAKQLHKILDGEAVLRQFPAMEARLATVERRSEEWEEAWGRQITAGIDAGLLQERLAAVENRLKNIDLYLAEINAFMICFRDAFCAGERAVVEQTKQGGGA